MTDTVYSTIAAAEAAIIANGYTRDKQRSVWSKPGAPDVKVARHPLGGFYIG